MYLRQYLKRPDKGIYRLNEYMLDVLLRNRWIKGNNNYQKFLILGWYRTGSNFLSYSINSHPNILCYSELFFPKKIIWGNGVYGLEPENERLMALRNRYPDRFLKEIVYRNYSHLISAVGFKIFYPQIESPVYNSLLTDILNISDLKIIHIKRDNYLNILVSQKIGARTGKMVKIKKKEENADGRKMFLKPDECAQYFNNLDRMISKYDSVFRDKDMLQIRYDDLVRNYEQNMREVYKFLGVREHKSYSLIQKQNKSSLSDRIVNYNELKEYFINSKWSVFFN